MEVARLAQLGDLHFKDMFCNAQDLGRLAIVRSRLLQAVHDIEEHIMYLQTMLLNCLDHDPIYAMRETNTFHDKTREPIDNWGAQNPISLKMRVTPYPMTEGVNYL